MALNNDPRSMRGILSRGPARYVGPSKSPTTGKLFNVQKAAQARLKKMRGLNSNVNNRLR